MLNPIKADSMQLPGFNEAIIGRCDQSAMTASVIHLSIGPSREGAHAGFKDQHDDIPLEAPGRYHLVPAPTPHLTVCWEIAGFDNGVVADLQIYASAKDLVCAKSITSASGTAVIVASPEELKLGKMLTYSNGPYLVRLRITKVNQDTKVEVAALRCYVDVLPIAVIGGGISGIRAAKVLLQKQPLGSVVILEARDDLGGRARTIKFNEKQVDLGCQYLQDWNVNPLAAYADTHFEGENAAFIHGQEMSVRVHVAGIEDVVTETSSEWEMADTYANIFEADEDEDEDNPEEGSQGPHDEPEEKQSSRAAASVSEVIVEQSENDSYLTTLIKRMNAKLENDSAAKKPNEVLLGLARAVVAEQDEGIGAAEFTKFEPELPGRDPEPNGANKMVPNGMGGLVTTYVAAELTNEVDVKRLEIFRDAAVKALKFQGNVVRITTLKGTVFCYGVVLTVPTEVINQNDERNRIVFDPPLENGIVDAFKMLPMGHLKKIVLPVRAGSHLADRLKSLLSKYAEQTATTQTDPSVLTLSEGVAWKFLYRMKQDLLIAFVGGKAAKDLDNLSKPELGLKARTVLIEAFKGDEQLTEAQINEGIEDGVETSTWSSDQWSLGAYSYTRPCGGVKARELLSETLVSGRMVFAGEAMRRYTDEYATAHGAWLSGEDAAIRLLKALFPAQ